VETNLPDGPSAEDVERLGYSGADLVSEEDDTALVEMTGALPLLVAESGAAGPVTFEPAASVPPEDGPTGSPGSDRLRQAWPGLGVFAFLLLAGPAWFLYKRAQHHHLGRTG
jgi:hypothetical protein